ncbi:MAG: hypothetical protein ABR962_02840 [Candidatus Bathyarchaeia archaeon]|jgi:hypothetical protein
MREKATILATACVMIVVVVFFEFYVFQITESYSTAYYDEFNKTPTPSYNYSFSPPVSMYRALLIALESGGWNATSLKNMTINVELDYCVFLNNYSTPSGTATFGKGTGITPMWGFQVLYQVTHPPADWSPQQFNGSIAYRYVWTIIVQYSDLFAMPPPGYYLVDAATAELVPTGPLY